jgi:hypothetical protein
MALVLEILVGVAILASLFVAYMSSRTWPIYQTVLVAFVFLSGVAFMYMGARTLKTIDSWGKLLSQTEKQVETLQTQLQQAEAGGGVDAGGQPAKGNRQLRAELERLTIDRGGVVRDAALAGVKEGTIQLTLKSPEHGLAVNTLVYVFDQALLAEGGRFRGEFKVVEAAENSPTVGVSPVVPLTEAEAQQLATAKGPWSLYLTMPIDDAGVFAALDDAARATLPKESQAEFASADRKLRDYTTFFHDSYLQRSLLGDAISKIESNVQRTEAATKEANDEIGYRQKEQAGLQFDRKSFQQEVAAIAAYQTTLEKLYQQVRESLKATYVANRELAAELAAIQFKATEEINRRSDSSVPSALTGLPAKR